MNSIVIRRCVKTSTEIQPKDHDVVMDREIKKNTSKPGNIPLPPMTLGSRDDKKKFDQNR